MKERIKSISKILIIMCLVFCFSISIASCKKKKAAHVHTYADTWSYNETYHWHGATCEHTDEKQDYAEHTFVGNTCSTCQYKKTGQTIPDTPTTVTVTFDVNGGTPEIEPMEVNSGATIVEPTAPRGDIGYKFDGWYLNGQPFDFSTPITQDITLTAQFSEDTKSYTVEFNSDGGTAVPAQSGLKRNQKATEPTPPTKDRKEFAGWYLNGQLFDFSTPIDSNITLVAHWNVGKVTVHFDTNGGDTIADQEVEIGGTLVRPNDPVKNPSVFVDWYLNDEPFDFSTPIEESITLEAHWNEKRLVSFSNPDGKYSWTKNFSVIVDYGKKITEGADYSSIQPYVEEPDPGFQHDNFEFVQWECNGVALDLNASVTTNMTFVAKWNKKFVVTFSGPDGEIGDPQIVAEGGYATTVAGEPDKEGHPFDMWTYAGVEFDFEHTPITDNINIFARYKHFITFNSDGGTDVNKQTVSYAGYGEEPQKPTKDHYYFLGWFSEGVKFNFEATAITNDINLIARWAFKYNGAGTKENPYLVETSEDLSLLTTLINRDSQDPETGFPYSIGYFKVTDTINMQGVSFESILNFRGVFDGDGNTIQNVTINTRLAGNVGFFGSLVGTRNSSSGLVKNLKLENVTISGDRANNSNIGILAGFADGATIQGCSVSGTITLNKNRMEKAVIGGLVGRSENSEIYANEVSVEITGGHLIGGIAGYVTDDTIIGSTYVTDSSSLQLYRSGNIGGLVGQVDAGSIVVGCYTKAQLKKSVYTIAKLSSLDNFGYGEGSFVNCFGADLDSVDKLGWNSADWTLSSTPELKKFPETHGDLTVTIQYDDADGQPQTETQTVAFGERAELNKLDIKVGYVFVGYKVNDQVFDWNTPIYNDITLVPYYESYEIMLGKWMYGEGEWIDLSINENQLVVNASIYTGEYEITGSNFRKVTMEYQSSAYEHMQYVAYDSYGYVSYTGFYYDTNVIYLTLPPYVEGALAEEYRIYIQRTQAGDEYDMGFLRLEHKENGEWVLFVDQLLPQDAPYSGYYESAGHDMLFIKAPYLPNFNNYNQVPFYDAVSLDGEMSYVPFIIMGSKEYADGTKGFTLYNSRSVALGDYITVEDGTIRRIYDYSNPDAEAVDYTESFAYMNSRWYNEAAMWGDAYDQLKTLDKHPKDPYQVIEYAQHNHLISVDIAQKQITVDGNTYSYTKSQNADGVDVLSYTDENEAVHQLWADYKYSSFTGVGFFIKHQLTPKQGEIVLETWNRQQGAVNHTWVEGQPDEGDTLSFGDIIITETQVTLDDNDPVDYDYVMIITCDGITGWTINAFDYMRFTVNGETYYVRDQGSLGDILFYYEKPDAEGHLLYKRYETKESFKYYYDSYEGEWVSENNEHEKLTIQNDGNTINGESFEYGWYTPTSAELLADSNLRYYRFVLNYSKSGQEYQFRVSFIREGIGYLYQKVEDSYVLVDTYYSKTTLDQLIGTWYYYDGINVDTIEVIENGNQYRVTYNGDEMEVKLAYNGYNSSPVISFLLDNGEKLENLHLIYSGEYGYKLMTVVDYDSYDAMYDEGEEDYVYRYGTEYTYFKDETIQDVIEQMSGTWTDGMVTVTIKSDEIIVNEPGYESVSLSIAYIYDLPSTFMDQYVVIMCGMDNGYNTHMFYYYNYYVSMTHFIDNESSTGYTLVNKTDMMKFRGNFEASSLNETHYMSFDGVVLNIDGVEYDSEFITYAYGLSADGETVYPILSFRGLTDVDVDNFTATVREGMIYYQDGVLVLDMIDTVYSVVLVGGEATFGDALSVVNIFNKENFYNSDIVKYNGVYEFGGSTHNMTLNDGQVFVDGALAEAEITILANGSIQVMFTFEENTYLAIVGLTPYGDLTSQIYQLTNA